MTTQAFALFETAIGICAVAWGEGGITGVLLPDGDAGRQRTRLGRRYCAAEEAEPPAEVATAIADMIRLLSGEPVDLAGVLLDMEGGPPFMRRAWTLARSIPPGRTMTYGELAAGLGDPGAARAVGEAMGKNPFPIIVPCHRVLGADGKVGGFSAPGGARTKLRMLEIEGALAPETLPLFGGRTA